MTKCATKSWTKSPHPAVLVSSLPGQTHQCRMNRPNTRPTLFSCSVRCGCGPMPGAHQPSSSTYRSRFSELYESAWPRAPGSALGSILASSNPPASQLVCCQFRGGRSSCRDPQIVPENRRARRKERNFPPSPVTERKKEARRTRSSAGSCSADSAVPMGKAADYYPDGCRTRSIYATNIIHKKFRLTLRSRPPCP